KVFPVNFRRKVFPVTFAPEILERRDYLSVITWPVKLDRPTSCRRRHSVPEPRRVPELLHSLGQSIDITWTNHEARDAVADDRARCRRDYAWQTRGHRLVGDHGRA